MHLYTVQAFLGQRHTENSDNIIIFFPKMQLSNSTSGRKAKGQLRTIERHAVFFEIPLNLPLTLSSLWEVMLSNFVENSLLHTDSKASFAKKNSAEAFFLSFYNLHTLLSFPAAINR